MGEENNTTGVLGEELETTTDQSQEGAENQNLADQTQEEDYLAQFVGEGKKYSTVEEAARALAKKAVNADSFIETLKQEKQQLEAKTQEAKTVEDIIAALNKENGEELATTQADPPGQVPQGLSEDKLEEWFQKREEKQKQQEAEQARLEKIQANQSKSWELLESEEYFGSRDAAKRAIREYIGEDDSKKEVVNNLGGYDPEGLAKLLKSVAPKKEVNFTDNESVVSPDQSYPKGRLTWEQVRQAEKENPALKKDRKWQRYVTQNLEL